MPRWDALLDISYALQIPIEDFFSGSLPVVFPAPKALPQSALNRRAKRKVPVKRSWPEIENQIKLIIVDRVPRFWSLQTVGDHLGVSLRQISRALPDVYRELSAHINAKKMERLLQTRRLRELSLVEAAKCSVKTILARRDQVTRRSLYDELRSRKLAPGHSEMRGLLAFAKQVEANGENR